METLVQLLPLIILIVLMYFLMIRPQKKKDKEVQEMRSSLTVGDEIVTIGGICGKIVKTKDETIIIQVGADKVKFEMMKWAVSSVTRESSRRAYGKADEGDIDDAPKKAMPKRLRRAFEVDDLEDIKSVSDEAVKEEASVDSIADEQ